MDFNRLCLKCMREGVIDGRCSFCQTLPGFTQEPVFALPVNTILHGRYLVGAVLGHGGFGITYVAYDLKMNQRVAIKEYMPDGLSTRIPGTTEMTVHTNKEDYNYGLNKFLEEARIIYKYNEDSNIISVSALFEENRTAYYIMEYLDGSDLKKHIASRGGKLGWTEASNLLFPVFDALDKIHSQSIIHRDISPDNIYVCKNGKVKLLDFGAARVALKGKSQSLSIILKRGFAPEEQYRSHGEQGPYTDVYALAGTLYYCLTGKIPPEATQRMYQDELIPPSELCQGLPPYVNMAIVKALSVKAENRYQAMSEFRAALKGGAHVAKQESITGSEPIAVQKANSSYSYIKANLGKRLGALILDGLLLGLVFYGFAGQLLEFETMSGYYLFIFIVSTAYGACCEASKWKATIGKRIMGLQVTDGNGHTLTFGKALLRNVVKYSNSLLSGLISIGVGGISSLANGAFCLMGSNKQAGHDLLAKTMVTVAHSHTSSGASEGFYESAENSISGNRGEGKQKGATVISGVEGVSGYYRNVFFPLSDKKIILGRNPEYCNIVFPNGLPGISRVHCEISLEINNTVIKLKDLGSSQGTFLEGGRRLEAQQEVVLSAGQAFTIGDDNTFRVKAS